VGGGVLLATLSTPKGLNTIRQTAEWGGNQVLNGTLSIGEISGNLWNQLIIHDLSMTLPDSLGGYEVIGTDEIWISFSLWNALTQGSITTAVMIDEPRIVWTMKNPQAVGLDGCPRCIFLNFMLLMASSCTKIQSAQFRYKLSNLPLTDGF
jgi:hypothetical protein